MRTARPWIQPHHYAPYTSSSHRCPPPLRPYQRQRAGRLPPSRQPVAPPCATPWKGDRSGHSIAISSLGP